MSETSSGIEFLKGIKNPFKKEIPHSFIIDNKNNVPRERIEKFTNAYKQLESSGAVTIMQDFIKIQSEPQNKPFAGLEVTTSDDGSEGYSYYVFFDRENVRVPATKEVREGKTVEITKKDGPVLKADGRIQQTAKGVKLTKYANGNTAVYAYMGSTRDEEGKTVEVGGKWKQIEGDMAVAEKLKEAGSISTPYFITESKNSCFIINPAPQKDTASQKPVDKVRLKP